MALNLDTLGRLANIDHRLGVYDYAVPIDWMMQDPENRRENVWWYPYDRKKPGNLRGRPLAWKALARLALRNMRQMEDPQLHHWIDCWTYLHPGKPLDAFGLRLLRRWMDEFEIESLAEANAHIILSHHDLPLPDFVPPREAPAAGQAA